MNLVQFSPNRKNTIIEPFHSRGLQLCKFMTKKKKPEVFAKVWYTRWLVAATCRDDTSQRQIALCVLDNFCENLCLCNRILLQQHVAKNKIRQNLCDLLRRQNFVAETKIFTKFPQLTQEAICRCDVSPQHVAATSSQTCTHGVICRRNLSPSV